MKSFFFFSGTLWRGIITAWMRTQRGGITTWTWPASRTTPPDSKVSESRLCLKQRFLKEIEVI